MLLGIIRQWYISEAVRWDDMRPLLHDFFGWLYPLDESVAANVKFESSTGPCDRILSGGGQNFMSKLFGWSHDFKIFMPPLVCIYICYG